MARIPFTLALVAGLAVTVPFAEAREPGNARPQSVSRAGAVADVLEAESQGLVQVKYIPNDSRSAQIIVTNVSRKPVTLRLPTAFAGVPVLAQMGGMGMGGGGGGAGFGAGGIGGGAQTMGGGAFSIPPQKTRVLRVTTVCLEHGKPEPSPRYPYKLSAIDSFSTDPKLAVVLEGLGRGAVSQKVAQAAAWHLSSGLSWERLAAEKIDHAGGVPDEAYFTPAELHAAQQVVAVATQRAVESGADASLAAGTSAAGK